MNKNLALSVIIISVVAGISISAGKLLKKEYNSKTIKQITDKNEVNIVDTSIVMKSTVSAISEPDKQEIKVTFIELGSVKCIPCKMMQPVIEEIEEEYAGQVKVIFYDVWTPEGQPYAKQYGIQGIPTQVFLDKDGNEFHRHIGYYPKEEIEKVLKTQGVK